MGSRSEVIAVRGPDSNAQKIISPHSTSLVSTSLLGSLIISLRLAPIALSLP